MPADEKKSASAVEDYFGEPNTYFLDSAALIVALVQNRQSATKTDYAHPQVKTIAQILKQIADGSRKK